MSDIASDHFWPAALGPKACFACGSFGHLYQPEGGRSRALCPQCLLAKVRANERAKILGPLDTVEEALEIERAKHTVEIAALREALEPFARAAVLYGDGVSDDAALLLVVRGPYGTDVFMGPQRFGDLRRAERLLHPEGVPTNA